MSFVPSADEATQLQFVMGALVGVQVWADKPCGETNVAVVSSNASLGIVRVFIITRAEGLTPRLTYRRRGGRWSAEKIYETWKKRRTESAGGG